MDKIQAFRNTNKYLSNSIGLTLLHKYIFQPAYGLSGTVECTGTVITHHDHMVNMVWRESGSARASDMKMFTWWPVACETRRREISLSKTVYLCTNCSLGHHTAAAANNKNALVRSSFARVRRVSADGAHLLAPIRLAIATTIATDATATCVS